ncbi:MAG: class I SAM-dependent methyltransferase [Pirellulales bacterium]
MNELTHIDGAMSVQSRAPLSRRLLGLNVPPALWENAPRYARHNYFGKVTPRYIALHRIVAVDRVLRPRPGERIVECGCGPGFSTVLFARSGAEVTALDISAKLVATARQLAAANDVAVRFLRADVRRTGLAPGSYDAAVSMEMLEHLRDWRCALASLADLVRPGGRVVVSTPSPYGLSQVLKTIAKRIGRKRAATYERFIWPRTLVRAGLSLGLRVSQWEWCGLVVPIVPAVALPVAVSAEALCEATPGLRRLCTTMIVAFTKEDQARRPVQNNGSGRPSVSGNSRPR